MIFLVIYGIIPIFKKGGPNMKIVTLSAEEFDHFADNHKYRNYYQTSAYGNLMRKHGFEVNYLGFKSSDGNLIGASLLLSKNLFGKYRYAYAPHGFLIDYNDPDLINELADKLQKLLLKQQYIFLKIDPLIHCSERNKKGVALNYNPKVNLTLEILKKAGFEHHGFNKYFETLKPRWNAVLRLDRPADMLFLSFDKQIRNKLRKAKRCGVEVYQGTANDIPLFYDFIKKKHNRNLKYYQDFNEAFQKNQNFEIYLAKINPQTLILTTKTDYERELRLNDEYNFAIQDYNSKRKNVKRAINKKMTSDRLLASYKERLIHATNLLKEHPDGIVIAACAIVKYDKGINLLIEGCNSKYSSFNPNYLLKWALIQKFSKLGYHYFNLNAITGEFNVHNKYSGLNEAKLGFNATAIEFIVEFDFIINPTMYQLSQTNFIRRKIAKKAS